MKNFMEYANAALKNKLFIGNSVGSIDIEEDIWQKRLGDRTYQIYLHSLLMVYYLTKAYNNTLDQKYINLAQDYLSSWMKQKHESEYIWHEYSTLSRLKFILFFIDSYRGHNIPMELLNNILIEHVDFLMNDKNYKKNNHGIMMDNALISSVEKLPKELDYIKPKIIEKVIKRSREAITRDFSEEGLHLENSPDYHRLTIKWLMNIEGKLNAQNSTLGKIYKEKLEASKNLESIIVMPDNRYPIYGDSSDGYFHGNKTYKNLLDREAGRVVVHNEELKSQLTFIAGYGSKGHKHYDDLSFIFHDGEEIIFNDSGKYNYEKNDPIRKHLISPLAHNSLSVYKKNYNISQLKDVREKIYISKYEEETFYKLIQGVNNSYNSVSLKRTILFFNDNSILILDQFYSEDVNTVAVNFNIGIDILVEKISRNEYVLKGKEEYILKSHINPFTSVLLNNTQNTICKISNRFGKTDSNARILLRLKTKRSAFLTTIKPKHSHLEFLNFENDVIYLVFREQKLSVKIS